MQESRAGSAEICPESEWISPAEPSFRPIPTLGSNRYGTYVNVADPEELARIRIVLSRSFRNRIRIRTVVLKN
jgi:hypothetical protein